MSPERWKWTRFLVFVAVGGSVAFWIVHSRTERPLEFSIESYELPEPSEAFSSWVANIRMKNVSNIPVKFQGRGKEYPVSELEVQSNEGWIDQSLIETCGFGIGEVKLMPGESVCFREVLSTRSRYDYEKG